MTLFFRPIDFDTQFDVFFNIRTLANVEVMGKSDLTILKAKNYIRKNLAALGDCAFLHLYFEDKIIGQMELGVKNGFGYVHLFYIYSTYRGRGYFKLMHQKMIETMMNYGYETINLATPPTNIYAIELYSRYGWSSDTNDTTKPGMVGFSIKLPTNQCYKK